MSQRMGKRKFFILVLLGLHSCASVPDHDLAVASSQVALPIGEILQTGVFSSGNGPQKEWWVEFQDPDLSGLIETALKLSPTLQIAESRLKEACEAAWQKRAALFPEVNFHTDSNWQHLAKDGFFRAFATTVPAVVNDINFDLEFTYEFDFWGKHRDIYKAALGTAQSMLAEKMQAELILTTSIVYSYSQLQLLLQKKELLEQKEKNRKRIENLRTAREDHDLDTQIQQLSSQIKTLNTAAMIVEINSQIDVQLHKIKALAGLSQDAPLLVSLKKLIPLPVTLAKTLSLDLVSQRPDLMAQKASLESAAKLIDAAKTDFYPNVNLKALVGFESVYWSKLFKGDNYSGSLDPAIHLPIFTAGRLRAQLREKVAAFNEAVYTYNEIILRAAQEVLDGLTIVSSLQKEIEIRKNSVEASRQQDLLIQKRRKHGLSDEMAELKAQNQTIDYALALTDLEYGKQLATILLVRALGGGYKEPSGGLAKCGS